MTVEKKIALSIQLSLGQIIRKHRKELNWSQERLAEEVDLSPRQISRIENGEQLPSVLSLYRLRQELLIPQDPLIEQIIQASNLQDV